jgi:hypothetical protein
MAIPFAIETSGSWKQIHNPFSGVVPWRDPVSRILLAEMRKHPFGWHVPEALRWAWLDRVRRILLAEMRKHPGGSAQQHAIFSTVPTGRLSQRAMSLVHPESSEPILLMARLDLLV